MRPSRPVIARLAMLIGVPAALVASGLIVSGASYSAFSADTGSPASNWSSGSVALANDGGGSALFTATGLKPGSTASNCIKVTSTGSLAATVKLFATGPATPNALATSLNLMVEQGTGGGFGTCTGFVADSPGGQLYSGPVSGFALPSSSFATGVGTWAPTGTGSESRVYRITVTLPSTAPQAAQGLTTSMTLTWEAQNS